MITGPLDLVVIQATTFCNLDCGYCYLPNRDLKSHISIEAVEALFDKIFSSKLIQKDFTIVWHAGEPLASSVAFYEKSIDLIDKRNTTDYKITHAIQSNGILINQEWCDFFKARNIEIGLSIDGPAFINDINRKDRKGRETHRKVMDGIQLLRHNEIPFHAIAVITRDTLDYPEEFFNFFLENEISHLAINIEELEGANSYSSLDDSNLEKFKWFISQLYDMYLRNTSRIEVREFVHMEKLILGTKKSINQSQQTVPFKILSIDVQGHISTFSPELLGTKSQKYQDFKLGNIYTSTIEDCLNSNEFLSLYSDILEGQLNCKRTCKYFDICGGGSPSNKYSENGSLLSTETNYCRYRHQAIFEVIISKMENELRKPASFHMS